MSHYYIVVSFRKIKNKIRVERLCDFASTRPLYISNRLSEVRGSNNRESLRIKIERKTEELTGFVCDPCGKILKFKIVTRDEAIILEKEWDRRAKA